MDERFLKNKEKFDRMAYLMYESDMARFERINKRLWILCGGLVIALLTSIIYGKKTKN